MSIYASRELMKADEAKENAITFGVLLFISSKH